MEKSLHLMFARHESAASGWLCRSRALLAAIEDDRLKTVQFFYSCSIGELRSWAER